MKHDKPIEHRTPANARIFSLTTSGMMANELVTLRSEIAELRKKNDVFQKGFADVSSTCIERIIARDVWKARLDKLIAVLKSLDLNCTDCHVCGSHVDAFCDLHEILLHELESGGSKTVIGSPCNTKSYNNDITIPSGGEVPCKKGKTVYDEGCYKCESLKDCLGDEPMATPPKGQETVSMKKRNPEMGTLKPVGMVV